MVVVHVWTWQKKHHDTRCIHFPPGVANSPSVFGCSPMAYSFWLRNQLELGKHDELDVLIKVFLSKGCTYQMLSLTMAGLHLHCAVDLGLTKCSPTLLPAKKVLL
jgi:hypothetical protein